jgi:two-component SAPR family response regulator
MTALRQTIEHFGGTSMAESLLNSSNQRYILTPDAYTSDVRSFEHTIRVAEQTEHDRDLAAAVPVYRHACDLYGGPYLADVDMLTDEIEERRTELLNAYLTALERLAEFAYQQGDDEQCLALCRRGIRFDPTDERLTLWMLRCYEHQRNESEIARVFRRYLRALAAPPDQGDAVVRWMRLRSGAHNEAVDITT